MGSLSKRSCMSKTILSAAVAVVLAAGTVAVSPAWAAEAKNTASKAAQKQLKASSDAMNAKNWNRISVQFCSIQTIRLMAPLRLLTC